MRSSLAQPVIVTRSIEDQGPSTYILFVSAVGSLPAQVFAVDRLMQVYTSSKYPENEAYRDHQPIAVGRFPGHVPWMLIRRDLVDFVPGQEFRTQQMADLNQEREERRAFFEHDDKSLVEKGNDDGGQYL